MAISEVIGTEYPRKSVLVNHFARFLMENYQEGEEDEVSFDFKSRDWVGQYSESGGSIYDLELAEDWVELHQDLGQARVKVLIDSAQQG